MNADFKELLSAFNANGVRYLVVGGYAVMEYTEPRFTKDLDVWIARDPENARAVFTSLSQFGAPLEGIGADDFTQPGSVYQIGVSPVRIDVLMSIAGVEFEEAWSRREVRRIGDLDVPIISREDLILNKKALGRPQDRMDIRRLREARKAETPKRVPRGRRGGGQ